MTPLSFSVANFKSFGSRPNEIPLRPITLVFGPKSAGKSSLLQALMYLDWLIGSTPQAFRDFPDRIIETTG